MSNIVLEAKNLTHFFNDGGRELSILDQVNLTVAAGQKIGIMGSSGSGKSTLLYCLAGLLSPKSGEIFWQQKSLKTMKPVERDLQRNRSLGFIYQFHHILPEFTALENIALPLLIAGFPLKETREKAMEGLKKVRLTDRAHHLPSALSGGERQRVAIARALINRPLCILADEPTGNLDPTTRALVWEMMLEVLNETQTALIMVTHDPLFKTQMDTMYNLDNGRLIENQERVESLRPV